MAALATGALVNLCTYSAQIKESFLFENEGIEMIIEYLDKKEELILINILRLIQVIIADPDNIELFSETIAEAKDQAAVKLLLKIR